VITRDVPDHALMVGNPARPISWMCQCGEKLNSKLHYRKTKTGLCLTLVA